MYYKFLLTKNLIKSYIYYLKLFLKTLLII